MMSIIEKIILAVALATAAFVGGCFHGEERQAGKTNETRLKNIEKRDGLENENRDKTAEIDAAGQKAMAASGGKIADAVGSHSAGIDGMLNNTRASRVPASCSAGSVVHGKGRSGLVRGTDLEDIGRDVKDIQQDSGELGIRGKRCAIKLTACQEKLLVDQKMAAQAN